MYVPEGFEDFHYIVAYSDNYVVLSDRRQITASWDQPYQLDVLVVYFYPSIYAFSTVRSFTSSQSFSTVDVSSDFYERADCNDIIQSIFILVFFIVFLVNGLTKFVKRGGIFFGS